MDGMCKEGDLAFVGFHLGQIGVCWCPVYSMLHTGIIPEPLLLYVQYLGEDSVASFPGPVSRKIYGKIPSGDKDMYPPVLRHGDGKYTIYRYL